MNIVALNFPTQSINIIIAVMEYTEEVQLLKFYNTDETCVRLHDFILSRKPKTLSLEYDSTPQIVV